MASSREMVVPDGAASVLKGLKQLFETGVQSDFTLFCDSKAFKVHKLVLLFHSDVLYKMSTWGKESQEGKVNLDDDDVDAVDGFVHYMYHLDSAAVSGKRLSAQLRLYTIANKYCVHDLEKLSMQEFKKCAFANSYPVKEVLEAIADAYDYQHPAPDAVRRVLAEAVLSKASMFVRKKEANGSELDDTMAAYPDFASTLIWMALEKKNSEHPSASEVREYRHHHNCASFVALILESVAAWHCPMCGQYLVGENWTSKEVRKL